MNHNAVKVTLDDGRSFICETANIIIAVTRLRQLCKVSASGEEVAYVAKVWYDFGSEVVR